MSTTAASPGRPYGVADLSTPAGRRGAAIRAARLARGLKAAGAARAIGVRLATYYNWEEGRRNPSLELAGRIAAVLHLPAERLLTA